VSGNLVTDSLWLKPPSEPMVGENVGSEPTSGTRRYKRTILSSNRKLGQNTGDLDVSTDNNNVAVTSNGGVSAPVLFGCVSDERGQIYRQKADGILGLADEALSIPSQLAGSRATSATFTLCYGTNSGMQFATPQVQKAVCQLVGQFIWSATCGDRSTICLNVRFQV
jgi:hypothetical protein